MSNQSKTARQVDDAYFTSVESARFCQSYLYDHDWVGYNKTILEPCAGDGVLTDGLPGTTILQDINPLREDVVKQDYLTAPVKPVDVVFTNPPFGTACNLAVPFFNKACKDSDRVAFIVPCTFRKASIMDRLNLNFHRIVDVDLPDKQFRLPDGSTKWVNCCFQMWERLDAIRWKIKDQVKITDYFTRLQSPEPGCYAFRTQGASAGKVLDGLDHSPASTAFLRGSKDRVLAHDWTKIASYTAGIPAIGLLDVAYYLYLEDHGVDISTYLN